MTTVVNKKKIKTKFGYHLVGDFSQEGFARAWKAGRWFHIGLNGKPIYSGWFDLVGDFINGQALVRKNREEFHIGPDGIRVD